MKYFLGILLIILVVYLPIRFVMYLIRREWMPDAPEWLDDD